MDGILINSEPLWREAEKKAFSVIGRYMTDDMCRETMGYRTREVADYWYEKNPWQGISCEELTQLIEKNVKQLIIESGKAMEGVHTSLDFFKSQGYCIALASSSSVELINTVVDKLNIRPYFTEIVSAENEKYGKPHPAVFIKTAELIKINPAKCIVIEDSFNGVIAAKAAKMKVIAIPDPEEKSNSKFGIADKVLSSLLQIDDTVLNKVFSQ
jgi:mannitol-1-/sugar-/sorbitol-6-/2-deoxyglucose-6-phosphatase